MSEVRPIRFSISDRFIEIELFDFMPGSPYFMLNLWLLLKNKKKIGTVSKTH